MVQESRQHETEDKKHRELIEAKNNADNMAYQLEKTLRELGDKVKSDERSNIEGKISDLKQAAQTDDLNRIKKATDDAQNAFHALSQQLYAQGQPQAQAQGQPQQGGPSSSSSEGDVIEGEVKE
jgi:molecular chaperone DnaK